MAVFVKEHTKNETVAGGIAFELGDEILKPQLDVHCIELLGHKHKTANSLQANAESIIKICLQSVGRGEVFALDFSDVISQTGGRGGEHGHCVIVYIKNP